MTILHKPKSAGRDIPGNFRIGDSIYATLDYEGLVPAVIVGYDYEEDLITLQSRSSGRLFAQKYAPGIISRDTDRPTAGVAKFDDVMLSGCLETIAKQNQEIRALRESLTLRENALADAGAEIDELSQTLSQVQADRDNLRMNAEATKSTASQEILRAKRVSGPSRGDEMRMVTVNSAEAFQKEVNALLRDGWVMVPPHVHAHGRFSLMMTRPFSDEQLLDATEEVVASGKILEALRHVRGFLPDVSRVAYDEAMRRRYYSAEGGAPSFEGFPIDIGLLEDAANEAVDCPDALYVLPPDDVEELDRVVIPIYWEGESIGTAVIVSAANIVEDGRRIQEIEKELMDRSADAYSSDDFRDALMKAGYEVIKMTEPHNMYP